jgi:hypothetical protein
MLFTERWEGEHRSDGEKSELVMLTEDNKIPINELLRKVYSTDSQDSEGSHCCNSTTRLNYFRAVWLCGVCLGLESMV